jgi:hypothetical protein
VYRKLGHELDKIVLGEFNGFTLIYEENFGRGDLDLGFFCVWAGIHVGLLRRGDTCVSPECFWGHLWLFGGVGFLVICSCIR